MTNWDGKIVILSKTDLVLFTDAQEQQERDDEIMQVFKEAKLVGKSKSEVVKSKSSAPRIYMSNIVRELPKIINNQNVDSLEKENSFFMEYIQAKKKLKY